MMTNLAEMHRMLPSSQLVNITLDAAKALQISAVGSDSRKIGPGELFIALQGEHFDAHHFLEQVAVSGASAALISQAESCPKQLPALYVSDTRRGLGDLAAAWRRQHTIPVAVITGSNGKTTVKEMVAAIFSAAVGSAHTLMTNGNFNNEIGLPLTLLRLRANHQLAVVELGMNHPGETAQLAAIAQANIALINNAQREHQEFMNSVAEVAKEHAAVLAALPADGVAVLPTDSPYFEEWKKSAAGKKVIDFLWLGNRAKVDIKKPPISSAMVYGFGEVDGSITIHTPEGEIRVLLNTVGEHNIRNALAAAAIAIAAKVGLDAIQRGLESFQAVSGRMQKKQFGHQITLIDDTYNANPDSARAAIEALSEHLGRRCFVLGDMGEVGDQGPQFHYEVGAYAAEKGIDDLFTLGQMTQYAQQGFNEFHQSKQAAQHHHEIDNLNQSLTHYLKNNQSSPLSILIKGSRFMQMERVLEKLILEAQACS